MRTIAVTVEDSDLRALDGIVKRDPQRYKNRSQAVRLALTGFFRQVERAQAEQREAQILARHRTKLAKQARALVAEQARL